VGGTAYVDTSTTDVDSLLQLGDPPLPGRATRAHQANQDHRAEDTAAAARLIFAGAALRAGSDGVAFRLDDEQARPRGLVDSPGSVLMGEARLTDSFKSDSKWTASHSTGPSALPFRVTGVANKAASVQIPTERAAQPQRSTQ